MSGISIIKHFLVDGLREGNMRNVRNFYHVCGEAAEMYF